MFRDWWRDWSGLAAAFLAAFVLVAILVLLAIPPVYMIGAKSCEVTSKVMGVNHSFSLWTGCMIEFQEGKWVSLERYNAIILGRK